MRGFGKRFFQVDGRLSFASATGFKALHATPFVRSHFTLIGPVRSFVFGFVGFFCSSVRFVCGSFKFVDTLRNFANLFFSFDHLLLYVFALLEAHKAQGGRNCQNHGNYNFKD